MLLALSRPWLKETNIAHDLLRNAAMPGLALGYLVELQFDQKAH
jgi:hypothetical protein